MEMRARVCDLLGKEANRRARVVTFSHKRIKKVQHVNLQTKKFFSENLDRKVKLRLSTKGIKTVNKLGGIDAAAKRKVFKDTVCGVGAALSKSMMSGSK